MKKGQQATVTKVSKELEEETEEEGSLELDDDEFTEEDLFDEIE